MVGKTKHTAELVKLTADIPASIGALENVIAEVAASMDELAEAGLIYATEHWRKGADGKPTYFYLLYPQKNGSPRRRDYVGSNTDRIEEARAGIVRAEQYDQLAKQYAALETRVRRIADALHEARRYLASK